MELNEEERIVALLLSIEREERQRNVELEQNLSIVRRQLFQDVQDKVIIRNDDEEFDIVHESEHDTDSEESVSSFSETTRQILPSSPPPPRGKAIGLLRGAVKPQVHINLGLAACTVAVDDLKTLCIGSVLCAPCHLLARVLNTGVKDLCEQMLKRKKRRWWLRSWILRRSDLGASARLFKELELEDPSSYANILRMSVPNFKELLELVTPLIQKKDTKFR
ncbi:hypothetical protein J6590_101138 [Homalodisca vitripennis]|nr:hypothetical protein J6590_101138 [Homalodisca vitripennis]